MTFKVPVDMQDMMKMFEPDQIAKMFDPHNIMSAFDPNMFNNFDYSSLINSDQGNYKAMLAANKAAASAYKDFYEKQMSIFEDMLKGAKSHADALSSQSGADITQKQAEIYQEAVEKSFAIMTELATTAQKANEEAFSIIQKRVQEAISDLQDK